MLLISIVEELMDREVRVLELLAVSQGVPNPGPESSLKLN